MNWHQSVTELDFVLILIGVINLVWCLGLGFYVIRKTGRRRKLNTADIIRAGSVAIRKESHARFDQ